MASSAEEMWKQQHLSFSKKNCNPSCKFFTLLSTTHIGTSLTTRQRDKNTETTLIWKNHKS